MKGRDLTERWETGVDGKVAGTVTQLVESKARVIGIKQKHRNPGWTCRDEAERPRCRGLTFQSPQMDVPTGEDQIRS